MTTIVAVFIGTFIGLTLGLIALVLYEDYHDPNSPGYHFGRKGDI